MQINQKTIALGEAQERAKSFHMQSDREMGEYWDEKCEELERELRALNVKLRECNNPAIPSEDTIHVCYGV
jgi:hypothetical protein